MFWTWDDTECAWQSKPFKDDVCHVRANTQHIQLMHQTCMKMKMRTNHLCSQPQGRNLLRKGVTQLLMTEILYPGSSRLPPAAPAPKRKGPPYWQNPTATLEQEVSRDSREQAEDTSILGKMQALRNIFSNLSEERNLRDLCLKHHYKSTTQFKKRTTHSDIHLEKPGHIMTSNNTW